MDRSKIKRKGLYCQNYLRVAAVGGRQHGLATTKGYKAYGLVRLEAGGWRFEANGAGMKMALEALLDFIKIDVSSRSAGVFCPRPSELEPCAQSRMPIATHVTPPKSTISLSALCASNSEFRNLSSVVCYLSSVIRHLFSVLCLPSSVFRLLSSVLCQ